MAAKMNLKERLFSAINDLYQVSEKNYYREKAK